MVSYKNNKFEKCFSITQEAVYKQLILFIGESTPQPSWLDVTTKTPTSVTTSFSTTTVGTCLFIIYYNRSPRFCYLNMLYMQAEESKEHLELEYIVFQKSFQLYQNTPKYSCSQYDYKVLCAQVRYNFKSLIFTTFNDRLKFV